MHRARTATAALLVLDLLVLHVLMPTSASAQVFTDASDEAGVTFKHAEGFATFMMAGGSAFLDVDADGDDDLLITRGNGQHGLFENVDGVFADITAGSGLDTVVVLDVLGLAVGDANADGLPDVYLTAHGENAMLVNLGGGVFADVTAAWGLADIPMFSSSAAWADFDRDGDLDLYVGNYLAVISFPYHGGAPNRLFVNIGTATEPFFEERAHGLGVAGWTTYGEPWPGFEFGAPGPDLATAGCTLSVCTADYDDDGDADLLIGNDFGMFVAPNVLYRNDTPPGGPLAFTDVSTETGWNAVWQYNMGVNPSDYDGDGDWDFYLSDLGANALLRNDDGVFTPVTAQAGPVEGLNEAGDLLLTSWGTLFADFDNDGWEDLYVVNGFIPAASFIANEVRAPNHLWRNLGDGTFALVPDSGLEDEGVGRGVTLSDVNADGRLDLHLMNNGDLAFSAPSDRCRLFVNQGSADAAGGGATTGSTTTGGAVTLRLAAVFGHPEALGARVDAWVGEHRMRRQLRADPVFLSSASRLLHFGLGESDVLDRLTVDWPSGTHQELFDLASGAVQLEEPRLLAGDPRHELQPGTVALLLPVTNQDPLEHTASVVWTLALGDQTWDLGETSVPVAGRSTARVIVVAPVPPEARALLAAGAGTLTATVTDETSAAIDQARLVTEVLR